MKVLKEDLCRYVVGGAELYFYIYSLTDGEISSLGECGYKVLRVEANYTNHLENLYVVGHEIKRRKASGEIIKDFIFTPREELEHFCKSQFMSDFNF